MAEERVPCATPGCPNTIQATAARRNNGLCGPCARQCAVDSAVPQPSSHADSTNPILNATKAGRTLDYSSQRRESRPPANKPVFIAAGVVIAVTLIANALLVHWAASDRSWIALAIMVAYGPITNIVIGLLSLVFIPAVREASDGASVLPYVLAGTLVPLGAICIDALYILSLSPRGC